MSECGVKKITFTKIKTMKKIFTLMLIAFAIQCSAQEKNIVATKNNIKLNVPSLAVSTISLFYERQTGKKSTAQIGLRFTPNRGLPFQSNVTNLIALAADSLTSNFYSSIRGNGFAISPEYRFYLGKSAGKGFYFSPMGKYQTFGTKAILNTLLTSGTQPFNATLNGSLSSIGVGAQMGVQFWAGKHLTIDWMIAGLYYNRLVADISASSVDFGLDLSETQELYSKIAGVISSNIFSVQPTVTNQKIGIAGAFALASFKTGLCLGYRF
jgi:Protein of unknown function (DUF3575)